MVMVLLTFVFLLSFMIGVLFMMFIIYWRVFALVQLVLKVAEEQV